MMLVPTRQRLAYGLQRSVMTSASSSSSSSSSSSRVLQRRFSCTPRVSNDRRDDGHDGGLFSRPGPPPLPPKEQREFERLVRENANKLQFKPASAQSSEADAIHPQDRPKPSPDFEGDTNPQTGEIGGPKKEPLRWEKEWTYGGRATDF